MDVVCKAVTTDMDAWSAFAVGLHLSSANIALFGGYFESEGTIRLPKMLGKVGQTSTHVQFLLGFWLIYSTVILPPDQNNYSQSTGVKEIFENPACSQISCL